MNVLGWGSLRSSAMMTWQTRFHWYRVLHKLAHVVICAKRADTNFDSLAAGKSKGSSENPQHDNEHYHSIELI